MTEEMKSETALSTGVVVNDIMQTAIEYGATPAEPGEFTKRAFLNGRIDLSRAEAVMDLISAKNRYALESSVSQLKGSMFRAISDIRDALLSRLAFIESALDDPEHYSLEGCEEEILSDIMEQAGKVKKLLSSFDRGKYICEGIKTVILGKPNEIGRASCRERV